jgi:hypothetical protein
MAGDAIDRAAAAELAKAGRYVAIPSAARRAEAGSFVLPAVPRGGSVEDGVGGAQRGVGERRSLGEDGVGDVLFLK